MRRDKETGVVAPTQVTVPAATPTQRKGLGGISPMQVEDAEGYDLPVSYYTPRIETAPQNCKKPNHWPSSFDSQNQKSQQRFAVLIWRLNPWDSEHHT